MVRADLRATQAGEIGLGFLCRLKWANERHDTWTQLENNLFKQHARENIAMSISGQTRSINVKDDKTATILFEYVEEIPIKETITTN